MLVAPHGIPLSEAPKDGGVGAHKVDVHAGEEFLVCGTHTHTDTHTHSLDKPFGVHIKQDKDLEVKVFTEISKIKTYNQT